MDADVGDLMLSLTPADLPPSCSLLLQYPFSWSEQLDALVLYVRVASDPNRVSDHVLQFGFLRGFSDWKTLYGFDDYMHGLQQFSRQSDQTEPRFYKDARSDGHTEGFIAEFSFSSAHASIASEIDRCVRQLVELHSIVRGRESVASKRNRAIETSFIFPTEVRVICQQYLLYFIEFLRDLGVEATSELKADNAGRVLFTIEPIEKQQALDRIRMALDAYLQLPATEIEDTALVHAAPEVQRLAATVEHFKHQLDAMHAVIQEQRRVVTGKVVYTPIDEANQVDRDEVIFYGLIKIKPYDAKVVVVNLPELYRRLRKLFADD